ncbi:hypothetical protein EDD86DRAFT_263469 [Gorgonomyces haynaldii]|nr:hypothetical protein EDD86DRAFT_263469 [Gorgonomyces haynaldii]
MSFCVKLSGSSGHLFHFLTIIFFRSIVQYLLSIMACKWLKVSPFGPKHVQKRYLVARGLAGSLSLACYFYVLTHMHLGEGTVLFFISPVFVALTASVCLNEAFTITDLVGLLLCLLGVILVAKPPFIFQPGASDPEMIPATVALIGAFITSFSYTIVRFVGKRVHFMVHVHYFGLLSSIISMIGMIIEHKHLKSIQDYTLVQWIMLLGVGVSAFAAQCLLNASLQLAPAGPVALMRNLDVVGAFVLGVLFFGEIPEMTDICGAILIQLLDG